MKRDWDAERCRNCEHLLEEGWFYCELPENVFWINEPDNQVCDEFKNRYREYKL